MQSYELSRLCLAKVIIESPILVVLNFFLILFHAFYSIIKAYDMYIRLIEALVNIIRLSVYL